MKIYVKDGDAAYTCAVEGYHQCELVDNFTSNAGHVDSKILLEKSRDFNECLNIYFKYNIVQTLFQMLKKDMDERSWNAEVFEHLTGVSHTTFYDIMYAASIDNGRKPTENRHKITSLSKDKILAISIGLNTTIDRVQQYLEADGKSFGIDKRAVALRFLFTNLRGWSLQMRNKFLVENSLQPLTKNAVK